MDDSVRSTYRRDQNYQNPFDLLQDNGFVSAVLLLLFVAFLEIIVGVLYSTYCSYPQLMRSERNRRRAQYCVAAGCQSQNAEGQIMMDAIDITFPEGKNYNDDNDHPIKVSPGYSSRGHYADIQFMISNFLSDDKEMASDPNYKQSSGADTQQNDDDSVYITEGSREEDDYSAVIQDYKILGKPLKSVQHSRGHTQGYSNVASSNDFLPMRAGSEKRYSRI